MADYEDESPSTGEIATGRSARRALISECRETQTETETETERVLDDVGNQVSSGSELERGESTRDLALREAEAAGVELDEEGFVVKPSPLARRGPIPPHILDAVALMALNLMLKEDIALAAGLKPDAVGRLLKGDNPKFNKILEGYRQKLLARTAHHQLRLADLMDQSYAAVANALTGNDQRLAKETAFEVMDRALPQRAERLQPDGTTINLGFQTNIVQNEVTESIRSLVGNFGDLVDTIAQQDPERHVKTGLEAVPRAIEIEVVADEAKPLPDDPTLM